MTAAQARYLRRLCDTVGIPFDPLAALSKQRAGWVIRGLAVPQPTQTRADVRAVPCPECGAKARKACTAATGKVRKANHKARVDAARGSPEKPL